MSPKSPFMLKVKYLVFLLGLTYGCLDTPHQASFCQNIGSSFLPEENPNQWLLAHVDVETTGLIPGIHEMIDMGWVYTNLDGKVIDSLFIRIMPEHPERTEAKAAEINGFSVKKWNAYQALSPREAVDSLVAFHQQLANDKNVLLVAYNSQFDAAFLDHLFRSVERSWRELFHYFVLDIPSMAWSLGYRDLTGQAFMENYKIPDEPHEADLHTGISGALKNVRIYQRLVQLRNELCDE